jgi:hypothetical protein
LVQYHASSVAGNSVLKPQDWWKETALRTGCGKIIIAMLADFKMQTIGSAPQMSLRSRIEPE